MVSENPFDAPWLRRYDLSEKYSDKLLAILNYIATVVTRLPCERRINQIGGWVIIPQA